MKHLLMTIVCACMALALMAGAPKPDAARPVLSSENKPSVATKAADKKNAAQSLHQFLRERNLSLNDNRLTKKAPRRDSAQDLQGTRIAVMAAHALEDIDEDDNPILSDTVYTLGWNNEVYSYGGDGICDWYIADNFYGKYQIPFDVNRETGEVSLFSCEIDSDSVSSGSGRTHTDTITTTYFFTFDDFFNYTDGENVNGEIFDDGSIWFDGAFLIYTEIVTNVYRNYQLRSSDTSAYITPIIYDLYLLQPNGIHECEVQQLGSPTSPSSPYSVRWDTQGLQQIYWESALVPGSGSGSGHSGGNTPTTCGTSGGLKPKPIDPRRPRSPIHPIYIQPLNDLGDPTFDDIPVGNDTIGVLRTAAHELPNLKYSYAFGPVNEPLGGGGHRGGPLDPRRPRSGGGSGTVKFTRPDNSLISQTRDGGATTMQTPVYMFQYDDSTLFVYNLFGVGSTVNGMLIHQDGSMTLPGQALFYDEVLDDDFCNYSVEGDSLFLGNTGFVTPDTISWGPTVPHGLNHEFYYQFNNNRLYFTDGSQFELFLRGDVNKNGEVNISDVTALINHLLSGDFENSDTFSFRAADANKDEQIRISDVTALINYLLSGSWPD